MADIEAVRDLKRSCEGNVFLASLDIPHMTSVNACFCSEFLLTPAKSFSL